ncbi:MAG: amidohydrolase family protein [Alphaproteobacteria bacterium]|nr:amidohydrolase family protein [Alphaproteobacteria bacterium]
MRVSGEGALLDGRIAGPTTVTVEGGRIAEVRPWAPADPTPEGLLLPGLVNAHTHLELAWAHGRVPGGAGFGPWMASLSALQAADGPAHAGQVARSLLETGTAAVVDVCGGPSTLDALVSAGLGGLVLREVLGLTPTLQPALHARASTPPRRVGRVVERTTPHAVYSMHPALLEAALHAEGLGHPASLHIAEDADHARFLRDGGGPLADALRARGVDLSAWEPPGTDELTHLERLGLAHDVVLVHGVLFDGGHRRSLVRLGLPLVLCVRSNLHISGRTPDLAGLVADGVQLALGTDSLASSPDPDVLGEVQALVGLAPDVPLAVWLHAATAGGADAFRLPWAGRLEVGREPGVLRVHPERPWEAREWAVRPGGTA